MHIFCSYILVAVCYIILRPLCLSCTLQGRDYCCRFLKFSLGRFIMARRTAVCRVSGYFVLFKLLVSQLADFEFPVHWIIQVRLYDFKAVVLHLTAVLGINIRFKPLRWVILYKVLLDVLPGYVFGAALGFLIRVLRVIGAGCLWLRFLGL